MSEQNIRRALILFTLSPEKDALKKFRNADKRKSVDLIRTLIDHTITCIEETQSNVDFDFFVSGIPASSLAKIVSKHNVLFKPIIQKGNSFHERFLHSLKSVFDLGYDEVIITGNDSPQLDSEKILNAFDSLKFREAVIGPSVDGGFYLLALKRFNEKFFSEIDWHSEQVLSQLEQNLSKANTEYFIIDRLNDIDSKCDLKFFSKNLGNLTKRICHIIQSYFTKPIKTFINIFIDSLSPHINLTFQQLPPPANK